MTDPLNDPRLTAMGLLVEVWEGVTARTDAVLGAHGISGNDFDVLIRLARTPGHRLRMTDLAAQTGLSTSGITRIADRLERNGLLRREAHHGDRRAFDAVLTGAAERKLQALMPDHVAAIESALFAPLSTAQRDALLDALRAIRSAVRPGAEAGTTVA